MGDVLWVFAGVLMLLFATVLIGRASQLRPSVWWVDAALIACVWAFGIWCLL